MRGLVACMEIIKTCGGIIYRAGFARSSTFPESRLSEHLKIHESGQVILVGREEAFQVRLMGIQFATDAFPLGVEPRHQTLSVKILWGLNIPLQWKIWQTGLGSCVRHTCVNRGAGDTQLDGCYLTWFMLCKQRHKQLLYRRICAECSTGERSGCT